MGTTPQALNSPFTDKAGHISFEWLLFLNQFIKWVPAPAHANSHGTQGQVAYDSTYFYLCTQKDTWIRVALAGGF